MKTLLDLGCGDGRDAVYFVRHGLTVTAMDHSKSGIGALRKRHPEITSVLRDLRRLTFRRNSFDVIYAHLSLHYFTDSETRIIFRTLHRILKRNGLLFIKVKSTDDALYGKGEKLGPDIFRKGHTRHFFTKEYTREQLLGFKIVLLRKTSSVYSKYKSSFIEAIATK